MLQMRAYTIIDVVCPDCLAEDYRWFNPGEDLLCGECGGFMVPEAELPGRPHRPLWVTLDWLEEYRACRAGRRWFSEKYPKGADYYRVLSSLRMNGHSSWAFWLEDHATCLL